MTGDLELSQNEIFLKNGGSAWYCSGTNVTLSTMNPTKDLNNRRFFKL